MRNNVADFVDRATPGRGGARVGAGRRRKDTPATKPVRVPSEIAPLFLAWIKHPENVETLKKLMQG